MILDITGPIRNGMWTYGDPLPSVEIEQVAMLEGEGWKGHRLQLHTLAGTYIESADHLLPGRKTIGELPVESFVRRAWIAQLSDKRELEPITAAELAAACEGHAHRPGDALLIATGWDKRWQEPEFVTHCPFFTEETMKWVIERDVGLLGVDVPCMQDPRADDGTLCRQFFKQERLLLAPLVGLRKAATGPWMLAALPLSIPGVCGAPCRAILMPITEGG